MPHSYTRMLNHVIFACAGRQRWLRPELRERLFPYVHSILRARGSHLIEINGVDDHLHLLMSLPESRAISALVRDIKANSSGWIHRAFPALTGFAWQTGYAAFSVDPRDTAALQDYIRNQEEHHRHRDLQQEMKALFRAYGIEADVERFLEGAG